MAIPATHLGKALIVRKALNPDVAGHAIQTAVDGFLVFVVLDIQVGDLILRPTDWFLARKDSNHPPQDFRAALGYGRIAVALQALFVGNLCVYAAR
jgi:hypothetical protein